MGTNARTGLAKTLIKATRRSIMDHPKVAPDPKTHHETYAKLPEKERLQRIADLAYRVANYGGSTGFPSVPVVELLVNKKLPKPRRNGYHNLSKAGLLRVVPPFHEGTAIVTLENATFGEEAAIHVVLKKDPWQTTLISANGELFKDVPLRYTEPMQWRFATGLEIRNFARTANLNRTTKHLKLDTV